MQTTELPAIVAIEKEARRLEREHILALIEEVRRGFLLDAKTQIAFDTLVERIGMEY